MMTFGFGHLRLSPDVFWRMTLAEFAAAARPLAPRRESMDRVAFSALRSRYPDFEDPHG